MAMVPSVDQDSVFFFNFYKEYKTIYVLATIWVVLITRLLWKENLNNYTKYQ